MDTAELPRVLFVEDMARLLRTSERTVMRRVNAGGYGLPPPMASVDKRWRWSRDVVERWLAGEKARWRA